MTEEQVYLFDLNGFIVLKAVVKPKWIVAANAEQTIRASSVETSAINSGRR
ncbi:MAG: hypothetical protein QF773_11140 [Lentisphaeria bacterium]|jgi:hypothetical protein|nr:hypothetical protein [Lentisphaeria bacterium]